jgi:receptor protein-tyrosine kinase
MARRRWLTIVAMLLLGVFGAAAYSLTTTPTYHSKARVFVSSDASNSAEQYYAGFFNSQMVKSYADLATSRQLMSRVTKRLELDVSAAQLAEKINATVVQDTVIIELEALDPSPKVAQQLAQAEAEELAGYLTEVESTDKNKKSVKATVIDPANLVDDPVRPRTLLNVVIFGVLGLLLGVALAVARELLDNSVSSAEDVERITGKPVLSSVGFDPDVPRHPLISDGSSLSPRVEAFRLLRTNLQFLDLDNAPRSIVITSALPTEGKTSTAANLAIALAQTGRRVLLIDGDLRRPRSAEMLGLERSVGFTTVLVGRADLVDAIQRHTESGIYFLASGPIPPNPTEVLQSQASRSLLERAAGLFDHVIIDAPPLLPVSDAAVMARDVDGAILVVRHGKTSKDQLRQAVTRLQHVDARVLGVTVNMTPRRGSRTHGYGYGYEYEYSYEPAHKE